MRRPVVPTVVLLGALALGGCATLNLEPRATPGQVEGAFRRAERKALRHAEKHTGGKPHRVHVMVYEEDARDLIQISVPMWMVRMAIRFAEHDEPIEIEGVELDWREILNQGSGIHVQVHDDDSRILVWLE